MVALLAAAVLAGPPDVRALLADGRAGEAEFLARGWLAEDPADAARWALLADAVGDPGDAESLYREAIRLDPGLAAAWAGLGRAARAQGAAEVGREAFERALALDPSRVDAAAGRAEILADPAIAEAVLARFPHEPAAALLVARLAPARALEVLHGDLPAIRLARAQARLDRGLDARADLAGLPGAEASRLRAWADCLAVGTADTATWLAFDQLRSRALVGLADDPAQLLRAADGCAAAHAVAAAVFGTRGEAAAALDAWRTAHALAPDDRAIAASAGHALLMAHDLEAASRVLALADPADPDVALDRAELARREGNRSAAARILEAAEQASPWSARLVVARAALADRTSAVEILRAGFVRTRDPALLQHLRPLVAEAELAALLAPPVARLAPLPDALEIVVWGTKESDRRLAELEARLVSLGYGEAWIRKDGARVYAGGSGQPSVALLPDGLIDVGPGTSAPVGRPQVGTTSGQAEDGSAAVGATVGARVGTPNRRQRGQARWALLTAVAPELSAWREALCREGFEVRLLEEIPGTLDAVWREGVGLDGAPTLDDPAERRAEILTYWATRTCTPEGDAVRAAIARYLVNEVQPSPWPVTPAELADANRRRACPGELVL